MAFILLSIVSNAIAAVDKIGGMPSVLCHLFNYVGYIFDVNAGLFLNNKKGREATVR